jgi:hypothetical protein
MPTQYLVTFDLNNEAFFTVILMSYSIKRLLFEYNHRPSRQRIMDQTLYRWIVFLGYFFYWVGKEAVSKKISQTNLD